jgi:hypothetical protein
MHPGHHFCSRGYFAHTAGVTDLQTHIDYAENREMHHRVFCHAYAPLDRHPAFCRTPAGVSYSQRPLELVNSSCKNISDSTVVIATPSSTRLECELNPMPRVRHAVRKTFHRHKTNCCKRCISKHLYCQFFVTTLLFCTFSCTFQCGLRTLLWSY